MTAWELKEALLGEVDEDESQDWTEIHQQNHPEIKAFLQGRSRGKEEGASAKADAGVEGDEEEEKAASCNRRVLARVAHDDSYN